jgi:methyl-accepting chemotaxis protein
MSWLDNIRISFKVGMIVLVMSMVSIVAAGFAATQMLVIDENYSLLIHKVDNSATVEATAARWGTEYLAYAYKLLSETTDEGNRRTLSMANDARRQYTALMAPVAKDLPEQSTLIGLAMEKFDKAFAACQPIVEWAATVTSVEDNAKAAARLRAECEGVINEAITQQRKLGDALRELSSKRSDDLTDTTWHTIYLSLGTLAAGLMAGLALAMFIGVKGLSQPIGRLKSVMEAFANRDLARDVPGLRRGDEVGEMAKTVEVFKTNAIEVERMRAEQEANKEKTEAQRRADMHKLADGFEQAVGQIIDTVSSASAQLEASAQSLTRTAASTEQLSNTVAAASEEAAANVQSVAAASEEMTPSVSEISRQVQASARISADAVQYAQRADIRINSLSEAAVKIGNVVELINTIAGQTNLLALNATIEAARAGEAGRGFAVVAAEVKSLAEQTAKATSEIGQQVSGIQSATQESVEAIKQVGTFINRISEISSAIASAVEEQGAATQEITRNTQQAAAGAADVASNITVVNHGAVETGSASSQMLSAARSLASDSGRLKVEVQKFIRGVRTG